MAKKTKKESSEPRRPPVVSVLGHIDHGKTTLLDYIKKSKIADQEAGGITQHVTAYEISHEGSNITFVDTPGHEAFAKMRSRGAHVADIALLVISAVEGVKVQTEEALNYIREAEIPFIVVASKMDLDDKNLEKLKGDLNELDVKLEQWGGDVPFVKTSVQTGKGVNELLDVIMLVAELSDLHEKKSDPFYGVVIESHISEKRGPVATIIAKSGVLETGDKILVGGEETSVRRLEDFQGNQIKKTHPSQPVTILGFKDIPPVGGVVKKKEELSGVSMEAEKKTSEEDNRNRFIGPEEYTRELPVVIKTDVQGTGEALLDFIQNLPPQETRLKVVKLSTGPISEQDIRLASTTGGGVLGFRVGITKPIRKLAERENVPVDTCDVIYKAEDILNEHLAALFSPKKKKIKKGEVRILEKFGERKGGRSIIGGKVTKGVIEDGDSVMVMKQGEKKGEGTAANLQREDKVVEKIKKGQQCGIMFKGDTQVEKGDVFQVYRVEKNPPSL